MDKDKAMVIDRIKVLKKELGEMEQVIVKADKSLNGLRMQFIRKQGGLAELEVLIEDK